MKEARYRYFKGRLSSQFQVPEVKETGGIRYGNIRLEPRFYLRNAEEISSEDYASHIENRISARGSNQLKGQQDGSPSLQHAGSTSAPHVLQTGDALVEFEPLAGESWAGLVTEIFAEYPPSDPESPYRGWEFLAAKDAGYHGKISGNAVCKLLETNPEEELHRLSKISQSQNPNPGCMAPVLPSGFPAGGCNPLTVATGGGCLRGGCAQSGCGLLSLLGLLAALIWMFQTCRQGHDNQNQNIRIVHDTIYVKEGQQVKEFVDSTLIRKTDAILLPNVQFYTNSARLLPYSIRPIQELADYLGSHPGVGAIIKGYTDDVGDDEANLKLSQARAEAVRSVLISIGIEADRIKAIGYGETRPKVRGQTVEARALNRRVEVELVNTESVETRRSEKKQMNGND